MFSYKTILKRNEAAENIMKYPKIKSEHKETIKRELTLQTVGNYINKVLMIGGLVLLYRKKFFEKSSRFLVKEIGLIIFYVSYSYGFERGLSELFWSRNRDLIRLYARQKEQEFFELSNQQSPTKSPMASDDLLY